MSEFITTRREASEFKEVIFKDKINKDVKKGMDVLTEAVASTLGPNGKNVIVKRNFDKAYTKDGVTVARNIDFKDKYMALGARLIKEAAIATNTAAGDGTTCATILTHKLITEGLKKIKGSYFRRPQKVSDLVRNMELDRDIVLKELKEAAKDIIDQQEVIDIATISANEKKLGKIIGDIYNEIGQDGNIVVEESKTDDTDYEITKGLRFNSGYVSPWFMTNHRKEKAELENTAILITDLDISSFQPFIRLIKNLIAADIRSLLVIGSKVSGEALLGFVQNHQKKVLNICAVEAPLHGLERDKFMEDLALVTGGKYISRDSGLKLDGVGPEYFGKAQKIIVDRKNTIIARGDGKPEDIKERIESLKADYGKNKEKHIKERIARLENKVAILKVGGKTQMEVEEKKYRIEDATESTRIALEDGIVPGGEIALINASRMLVKDSLVRTACHEPFKRLIRNIDKNPNKLIRNVGGIIGYDAREEKITNMYEAGIIDPVKVPITALENAVSVAGNFLKSQAVVFNEVDPNAPIDEPLEV